MTEPVFKHLDTFIKKMTEEGISSKAIETFIFYYKQAVCGETGLYYEKDLEKLDYDEVRSYETLGTFADSGKEIIKNTVSIILNGGLGTSMGLTGPKSLLTAKDGKTFLEIIIGQAEAMGSKLAFMNSYNTHSDTVEMVSRIQPETPPLYFLQNKFPKILQKDFSPAVWPQDPELEWNPPGHGDIYLALNQSGLLEKLINQGVRYAFVSNVDNLGACIDEALLGYFAENQFPFMMEVSTRTPVDMKGGHLARHKEGYLLLRESAQCPKEEIAAFSDINTHHFFNTNNLWLNLEALHDLLKTNGMIKLPMILNAKTLDPRDPQSPPVYQIEAAMGAAISVFKGAAVVKVPRTRFFPVKKCSDILAIRSDYYQLADNNCLILNPDRASEHLEISLDPRFYGNIDQLDARFNQGAPSLVNCRRLSVTGDVLFEKNVVIRGSVSIENPHPDQKTIQAGSIITQDLRL